MALIESIENLDAAVAAMRAAGACDQHPPKHGDVGDALENARACAAAAESADVMTVTTDQLVDVERALLDARSCGACGHPRAIDGAAVACLRCLRALAEGVVGGLGSDRPPPREPLEFDMMPGCPYTTIPAGRPCVLQRGHAGQHVVDGDAPAPDARCTFGVDRFGAAGTKSASCFLRAGHAGLHDLRPIG